MIIPNKIPKPVPSDERVKDSNKNWNIISVLDAPRAFLIPISLVRSVTVIIMMLMMPILPINSDIHAITNTISSIIETRFLVDSSDSVSVIALSCHWLSLRMLLISVTAFCLNSSLLSISSIVIVNSWRCQYWLFRRLLYFVSM